MTREEAIFLLLADLAVIVLVARWAWIWGRSVTWAVAASAVLTPIAWMLVLVVIGPRGGWWGGDAP